MIISFVMFCVQLRIATMNLMNPPLVDSTYERNLTVDELPLITICPVNQFVYSNFRKLSYTQLKEFLKGEIWPSNDNLHSVSWGGHENLTFIEVLNAIYDENVLSRISISPERFNSKKVYVAKFGYCLEISEFDPEYIEIYTRESKELRLMFTDKSYRSYFMPDISSHLGGKILIKPGSLNNIDVQLKKFLGCDSNHKDEKRHDFQTCIDSEINSKIGKPLGCIPPWLSENNQCNETYPANFLKRIPEFDDEYLWPPYTFANSKIEAKCKTSCKSTKYLALEREPMSDDTWGAAFITFDQNVHVTEKIENYSLFQYIIDVGSSLGLWLGLSVLGLHDLLVMAVDFFKSKFICNK